MTDPLTDQQKDQFVRLGVIRLPGLIAQESVRRARDRVRSRLGPIGLWRDGAWRLDAVPRPRWPEPGLRQASKVIGNKHSEIEALAEDPALLGIVDGLLGGRARDRSMYRRPMTLFTLPNIDVWTLPTGWHIDLPRLASGQAPGVQMFTFLEAVGPRGGGPCVIAGSHRLLNDGRALRSRDLKPALAGEPFFGDLFAGRFRVERPDASLPVGHAAGVRLEVMELSGAPGDVWLVDLRALHATTPNASDRPRLMVTDRFVRAELMGEIAGAASA